MVNKEVYLKSLSEYIDLKKNFTYEDEIEDVFDFIKQIDVNNYNIEFNKKQTDIEKEVKAWKKFYLNTYQKQSLRDFEPFITRGEIADFIISRLGIFDSNGNVIGVDSNIDFNKIFKNIFNKQIRAIREAKTIGEASEQAVRLLGYVRTSLANRVNELTATKLEETFTGFLLEVQNKITAESFANLISEQLPNSLKKILSKESQDRVVDFLFDSLTDYSLRALPDFEEFSGIGNRLRARWREFLRKGIFDTNKPIQATDVFNVVLDVFQTMKKDFFNTRNLFKLNFSNLLQQAVNKRLNALNFNEKIRELIRGYGRSAFRNGIESLGLDPKDFGVLENFLVSKMNNYVRFYVTSLTSKVVSGALDMGKALITGDSWANKLINKIFEYGRLAADRNGLYEWVFGDTKHCPSCLAANGQRHRLKHWHQAGILPQSNGHKDLICGGYHCKCKLVRVTGLARGRLGLIPTR